MVERRCSCEPARMIVVGFLMRRESDVLEPACATCLEDLSETAKEEFWAKLANTVKVRIQAP